MRTIDVLKAYSLDDKKIKLPKKAQVKLSEVDLFTYFLIEKKLNFENSIVRNANIADEAKKSLINAKASIRTKRAEIRQAKKESGVLFDSVAAEEKMYRDCTKAEQSVLDGYVAQALREKSYIMYGLSISVLEWDGENPVSIQFSVKSNRITKTGRSKPITYGVAKIQRNYVQISDFIPTVNAKAEELVAILNTLFDKWNKVKKAAGNWADCSDCIQSELKEMNSADFKQVCKWIELSVQD